MKNKSTKMLSLFMCLILIISTFAACSIKDVNKDSTTTTLIPDENWQVGVPDPDKYEPVKITNVELVELVSEALGEDAEGFNGDLNTLTPDQKEKVEQLAQDKGLIIDKDDSGNTVIKKEPTTEATPEEISSIFNQVSVKDPGKVTPSEYEEISSIANENGMTAVTDKEGNVEVVKPITRPATTTAPVTIPPVSKTEPTKPTKPPKVTTTKYKDNTPSYNPPTAKPLDPLGTTLIKTSLAPTDWNANYGKNNVNYLLGATDLTKDGGIVATGTFLQRGATEETLIAASGSCIVKYNEKGKLVWQDTLAGNDITIYQGVATLNDGSIVAVGYTTSTNIVNDAEYKCKGTSEAMVVKYSAKGDRQWIKIFGGSGGDEFYSVAATPDGGFIVGGQSNSSDFDLKSVGSANNKAIFVKYNADGAVSWKKALSGGNSSTVVRDLDVNSAGVIFGSVLTGSNAEDFANLEGVIAKKRYTLAVAMSANGEFIWKKAICDEGSTMLTSIVATDEGGCVLAGNYSSGKNGNTLFFKDITNGGSYGTQDGVLVKFASNGAVKWITPLKGYESDNITGIAKVSGGYAVSGHSASGNRDFTGSASKNGDYNAFVYIIGEHGDRQTMNSFGGSRSDNARAICSDGKTSVFTVGSTNSDDGFAADFAVKATEQAATAFVSKLSLVQ